MKKDFTTKIILILFSLMILSLWATAPWKAQESLITWVDYGGPCPGTSKTVAGYEAVSFGIVYLRMQDRTDLLAHAFHKPLSSFWINRLTGKIDWYINYPGKPRDNKLRFTENFIIFLGILLSFLIIVFNSIRLKSKPETTGQLNRKPWFYLLFWLIFLSSIVQREIMLLGVAGDIGMMFLPFVYLLLGLWVIMRIIKPKENRFIWIWYISTALLIPIFYFVFKNI